MRKEIILKAIGELRTCYGPGNCPFQPPMDSEQESQIIIFPEFQEGLKGLEKFNYIYVLFYLDRSERESLKAHPPWLKGKEVGVFASRSPHRPNFIGMSIVRLKRVEDNVLITSPVDAYDRSPVLDLKPYFKSLDCKEEANLGWLEKEPQARERFEKQK